MAVSPDPETRSGAQPRDPRVALITGDPGWHGRRLAKALAQRGLSCVCADLAKCSLELDTPPGRVCLPGFAGRLPRAAFVRGIAAGSLEQIVTRLNVLHALEQAGVRVCNPPRVIERSVDKGMSSLLLLRAGLPTPPTRVCETPEAAAEYCRRAWRAGRCLVLKPLFGSQGKGLCLLSGPDDLERCRAPGGTWYLQYFVERGPGEFRDLRVLVIDGRARAAMRRASAHWITNRARGARCEAWPLEAESSRLAEAAARALGARYAGVDLVPDAAGRLQVLEVNGVPSWRGLQQFAAWDIAGALVELLGPAARRAVLGTAPAAVSGGIKGVA